MQAGTSNKLPNMWLKNGGWFFAHSCFKINMNSKVSKFKN